MLVNHTELVDAYSAHPLLARSQWGEEDHKLFDKVVEELKSGHIFNQKGVPCLDIPIPEKTYHRLQCGHDFVNDHDLYRLGLSVLRVAKAMEYDGGWGVVNTEYVCVPNYAIRFRLSCQAPPKESLPARMVYGLYHFIGAPGCFRIEFDIAYLSSHDQWEARFHHLGDVVGRSGSGPLGALIHMLKTMNRAGNRPPWAFAMSDYQRPTDSKMGIRVLYSPFDRRYRMVVGDGCTPFGEWRVSRQCDMGAYGMGVNHLTVLIEFLEELDSEELKPSRLLGYEGGPQGESWGLVPGENWDEYSDRYFRVHPANLVAVSIPLLSLAIAPIVVLGYNPLYIIPIVSSFLLLITYNAKRRSANK